MSGHADVFIALMFDLIVITIILWYNKKTKGEFLRGFIEWIKSFLTPGENMDEYIGLYIHDEYIRILEKIKDGKLYGETMDLNNPEMIVVAAYFIGFLESHPELTGIVEDE